MTIGYSDYLQQSIGNVLSPWQNVWVGLVSNNTSTAYKADGLTDSKGKFTFTTKPPGDTYTVYTSPTGAGLPPGGNWSLAGDSNYAIPVVQGENPSFQSTTAQGIGPYSSTAPPGIVADESTVCGTGIDYTGATDSGAAVAAFITAAHGAGFKRIRFLEGTLKSSVPLPAYSNMVYEGVRGRTRLYFAVTGSTHGFYDAEGATTGAPMTDTNWRDMEVDGSGITGTTSKGFFIQYMLRPIWERVWCHDFPATGFGCDFLQDYRYLNCRAENNGRLLNVGDAGASGIGIGTGEYQIEDGLIQGCTAIGNKNFGIFWEQQPTAHGSSPYYVQGVRAIGNECRGNNHGMGDCGLDGLNASANHLTGNTQDGFQTSQGTGGGIGAPGYGGLIHGNTIRENGRYGVFLDYRFKATNAANSRYAIRGNAIRNNTTGSVQLSTDTVAIQSVEIEGNELALSGANGIQATVLTSGDWPDLAITRNRVRANGQTNVSGFTQGIRITASTTATYTRLRIKDNRSYDDGGVQKQTYGLQIDAGVTLVQALIEGNDLRNNVSGGALLSCTFSGTANVVRGNPGYNPVGVSAITTTLPIDYFAGPTPEDIYLIGGTLTAVKIGGSGGSTVLNAAGQLTIHLEPGQELYVTGTGNPVSAKTNKL